MELTAPAGVHKIVRKLEAAGFSTWAVGGAVRDSLLGHPTGDWDLATAATPDQVMGVFRRTVPIGVDHGTVGVLDGSTLYEVTTFRRDVETFGRHAVVAYADSVAEDLSRRDFTINAVAWHPLTGEVLDPYGGQADLEAHRLRTVGDPTERFAEDYLRVLRALRFANRFDLEIDPPTWAALKVAVPHLAGRSAERVKEELGKLLEAPSARRGLELYRRSGAMAVLYPELEAVGGERSDPEGRFWRETLTAVDVIPPHRAVVRWAALLHAVGKPASRTQDLRGGFRYTGHEVLGSRLADAVMRRLKGSTAERERVVRLVRHQSDLFPPDAPAPGVRRWLRDTGPDLVYDLFRLRFALCRAEGTSPDDLVARWRIAHRTLLDRPVLEPTGLAIGGHELQELGLEPGPRFGEILRALTERVIDDPALNTPEQLRTLVREEWLDA